MTDPSDFDTPLRREGDVALHEELVSRLHQHGVMLEIGNATLAELADLLSAIDAFETAVARAGGDLFVDSPDSSEPERPDFVLPHPLDDERISTYTKRIAAATQQLE